MQPISGRNDEALTAVGTDVRELITGANFDADAVLFRWMGSLFTNEHATALGLLEVYDSDEDTGPAAAAQRGAIYLAPEESTLIQFVDPGIRFAVNLTAGVSAGTLSAQTQATWGFTE